MNKRGLENALYGLLRRYCRYTLKKEVKQNKVSEHAGITHLRGYGLHVSYPNWKVWLHQFIEIFCDDCYRVHKLKSRRPLIVDVGANVGMATLYFKWRLPDAKVIAVEPDLDNIKYLVENITNNQVENVRIVNAAVKEVSESVSMVGGRTDSMRAVFSETGHRAVLLNSLIQEPCDFLKMDIEGSELEVLSSSQRALSLTDRVCIEYHQFRGRPFSLTDLVDRVMEGGFNRLAIDGHRTSEPSNPIEHYCLVHAWRD